LPNLTVVRCVKTACEAIEAIVRQGEGSDATETNSHYQRFLRIREEYQALHAARPDFVPARPAAHNPVMRRPPVPEGRLWVNAEPAASLLDIGNAIYNHSVRCLALSYAGVDQVAQKRLVDASIELMRILTPVAEMLTKLPANPDAAHCTAGLSFATLRSMAALPAEPGAITVLAERLGDIAIRARGTAVENGEVAALVQATADRLDKLALRLGQTVIADRQPSSPTAVETAMPEPATAAAATPPEPIVEGDGVEIIPGQSLDLVFQGKRCIHARHCVLGQPKVFKANVEGPWIDPDAATTEALVTVAQMCPSGAIGYRRHDGGPNEASPPVNLAQLRENGPIGVRAEIVLDGEAIGYRATLCRCGASKNKPFCDGSHHDIDFTATGEPATVTSEPLAVRGGRLEIDPETDGPLVVNGSLEICAGTGRTVTRVTSARLCRCGASANKPFCDNSHRRIGFKSGPDIVADQRVEREYRAPL